MYYHNSFFSHLTVHTQLLHSSFLRFYHGISLHTIYIFFIACGVMEIVITTQEVTAPIIVPSLLDYLNFLVNNDIE